MTLRMPEYRDAQLKELPRAYGVYALCDLDNTPVYVGKSWGGKDDHIASRVRRHLTSARSDVIANRLIDIWEIGYVRAWVCDQSDPGHTDAVEHHLFNEFNAISPLMNGAVLAKPELAPKVPAAVQVQVLPSDEIARRQSVEYRFPRQIEHVAQMVDWMLETAKENQKAPMIRRALLAHFERLNRYHATIQNPG